MFKLESYIAPILLSYVDKYIKNFRLEDSQVSLWGGDASFQNLDLRLEVLEQELQSPFSFISGHIRELLIHVPWTKLTSEPITITINTIECVLKLKDSISDNVSSESSSPAKDKYKRTVTNNRQEVEAPPNYIQLLINKIVSNIRIYCNNLILKYVEEDIVLSMNVKHLKVESCNEKWEAAYSDISPTQVIMRKVIKVNDLTVCLDKRNTSGKIDVYQEPMLYRCSMTMHLLRTYHSATSNKTSLTRLDVYCNKMEFSMTEQQVPMFLRLALLLYALQQKQLKPYSEDGDGQNGAGSDSKDSSNNAESWTGWAWSYVTAVLPTQWDESLDQDTPLNQSGHIVQIGFYVDDASLTFKLSDSDSGSKHGGYYGTQKKIRYSPLLTLRLQGIYMEMVAVGKKWFNMATGVCHMGLLPMGCCSCSHPEDEQHDGPYLSIGTKNGDGHKLNSLFDVEAVENKEGRFRSYNTNWDFHMFTNTEAVMLERSGAFACDYTYQMEVPDDSSSEVMSDLGSNLEFSNLAEKSSMRACFGPTTLRACSGLFHRLKSLKVAASSYDYPPYYVPKPDPPLQDLLPPSEEDYEALNSFIPTRVHKVMCFDLLIELQFVDHPSFEPTKECLFKKPKKSSGNTPRPSHHQSPLPKIRIECKLLELGNFNPMYVNRLVHTTCQLPQPPSAMFEACFSRQSVNVVGLSSRLLLKAKGGGGMIVVPFNFQCGHKSILKPQYWPAEVVHTELTFSCDNLTLNCTKSKLLLMSFLVHSVIDQSVHNLKYTSLLYDATQYYATPYIELCIDGTKFKRVATSSTISLDLVLGSLKAFIFESGPDSNIQQVLFLSGPDFRQPTDPDAPLFTATLQYPIKSDQQVHPSLLVFTLREINVCLDPLVCKWLLYRPTDLASKSSPDSTDASGVFVGSNKKSVTFEQQRKSSQVLESVHGSSEAERDLFLSSQQKLPCILEAEERVDVHERIYEFLKVWHGAWKGLLVNGHVGQCNVYLPMASISSIGSQGVEEAVKEALKEQVLPQIMVITLPTVRIHSNNAQKLDVTKLLNSLPITTLPETFWTKDRPSFPWTISISDLSCSSMESERSVAIFKPVSLNATVGLSTTKNSTLDFFGTSDNNLGVYVHIDVTPIVLSLCQRRVCHLTRLAYGLLDFVNDLSPSDQVDFVTQSPPLSASCNNDDFMTTTSEASPPRNKTGEVDSDATRITAWIQWTVTKFSIELVEGDSKLIADVEDIVSSLDYQSVYLKLKTKIGSTSVQHFSRKKHKWQQGPFGGCVMRLRDDLQVDKRAEDSGFISVTITRASSFHTHSLWGHSKSSTLTKPDAKSKIPTRKFMTEIVIVVQPIDIVVSLQTLIGFYPVFRPLIESLDQDASAAQYQWFNNQNLPLAYLECSDIRIMVPTSMSGTGNNSDVYVVQIEKITLSPTAINPICRAPLRPDIYRQAAHARILTVPGSELEDRQYQLDITSMGLSTTNWRELDQILNTNRSNRSVINENPALEWNKLDRGGPMNLPTTTSVNIFRRIVDKFDISVIAAPAMIFKGEIICSNSFEVNFVSDLSIQLSLNQIKLLIVIMGELSPRSESSVYCNEGKVEFPYSRFGSRDEFEMSEFYRDSGIDTSEVRSSVVSQKSPILEDDVKSAVHKSNLSPLAQITPYEILFTAGKISCCLFQNIITTSKGRRKRKKSKRQLEEDDRNYEASEEESVDDIVKRYKKHVPLLYAFVSQPNAYFSRQYYSHNVHVSCFDIGVKLSQSRTVPTIPTVDCFQVDLIATRSGNPHPVTGIPPAFFNLKYWREHGKSSDIHVDISRPTKVDLSIAKMTSLVNIRRKFGDLRFPVHRAGDNKTSFKKIRDLFKGIDVVQVRCEQIVLAMTHSDELEASLIVGKLRNKMVMTERPEKIQNFSNFECVTLSYKFRDDRRLVLNPWTVSLEVSAFLEHWHSDNSPQVHVAIDSDCLILDLSPDALINLGTIVKELADFGNSNRATSSSNSGIGSTEIADSYDDRVTDQHYKDDLRAGAFQFIEAASNNGDELPLPYQVMFWNYRDMSAMAWRYPQPRALTKVRIFPVPFELVEDYDCPTVKVLCDLQYYSEPHCAYISYTQFQLSECEVCYLKLPNGEPQNAVAYVWRVVLTTADRDGKKIEHSIISPRALAACMRIDSYFNNTLIANLTAVLYVSRIELALFSNFHEDSRFVLPDSLKDFRSDRAIPAAHCFVRASWDNLTLHASSWNFRKLSMDASVVSRCSVLDYTFLTEQVLCDPFSCKLELSVANKLDCGLTCSDLNVYFGSSIAHTLTLNAQLWSRQFATSLTTRERSFLLLTKYVVCNDTNVNMRFGQMSTDENVLLASRCFHLYAWRSPKSKRKLKVGFEEKGWIWSKPFRIDQDGTQFIQISLENNMSVVITIKTLSTTQKQIVISGQFVIANMLLEHFEFKIIPADRRSVDDGKPEVLLLGGKTVTPTMFIDYKANYFLRLRFFGLEAAWTGDIPLKEHTKGSQPWLVKVPLQERGQFLSIWCKIVVQDYQKGRRILAMLWPLFMVKSNLPVTSQIHIETPTLNVKLDSTVKGKGETQQLYCPGTIDHSHQLTFKLSDGTSISDHYIPLNYSLVDQQQFFKKGDRENIEEILDRVKEHNSGGAKWPYFGEDFDNVDWVVEDQPQTTVQVRYQNACQYSSALMVELLPWCLLINTFGCPVALMVNGIELCKVQQHGIVAPPKLDVLLNVYKFENHRQIFHYLKIMAQVQRSPGGFNARQQRILFRYLKNHEYLRTGRTSSNFGRREINSLWDVLASDLNRAVLPGVGVKQNPKSWRKVFWGFKNKIKNRLSQGKPLTELEKRINRLINGVAKREPVAGPSSTNRPNTGILNPQVQASRMKNQYGGASTSNSNPKQNAVQNEANQLNWTQMDGEESDGALSEERFEDDENSVENNMFALFNPEVQLNEQNQDANNTAAGLGLTDLDLGLAIASLVNSVDKLAQAILVKNDVMI